ncbi:MAG: 3-isopropylmalate dehydrogenase [Tepidanaerobacteraceae bacterium]
MHNIAVLPGDGIGPEVTNEVIKILQGISEKYRITMNFHYGLVGGAALDELGEPLPKDTVDLVLNSDAILFGAVGEPKWDGVERRLRPEQAILGLRKNLGLYANLRPARLFTALRSASALKNERLQEGFDILIVRELTGGLYYGTPKGRKLVGGKLEAFDTMAYTEDEIERIANIAFEAAQNRRKRLTSVDKANVLETSRLWREVVERISANYPEVSLSHMYVDNCCMQLISNPEQFDVILTENTFGDIISDEAGALTGSLGTLPSASIGDGKPFIYEPVHGSAPDMAGKGMANPIGCILSAAMMLEYSFGYHKAAKAVISAVEKTLDMGYRTCDMASDGEKVVTTKEMGEAIKENLTK